MKTGSVLTTCHKVPYSYFKKFKFKINISLKHIKYIGLKRPTLDLVGRVHFPSDSNFQLLIENQVYTKLVYKP